jgi:anti-anti-sigma factor
VNLSYSLRHESLVVTIAGRLDALSAEAAQQALLGHIAAGASRLVVDASQLDYISSAGIRVLLVAAKAAGQKPGGRFAVAAPTALVRKILADCGLDTCLGVVADVTEAAG